MTLAEVAGSIDAEYAAIVDLLAQDPRDQGARDQLRDLADGLWQRLSAACRDAPNVLEIYRPLEESATRFGQETTAFLAADTNDPTDMAIALKKLGPLGVQIIRRIQGVSAAPARQPLTAAVTGAIPGLSARETEGGAPASPTRRRSLRPRSTN